jgi:glycosyltransferase involved in cell wall biosynthesis
MSKASLSLCMIVRNEERTLPRCLDAVRSLCAELVIVDTGSTDMTPEIASGYGAKVSHFDFTFVDFAAARNHGLKQANGEWILVLDADEILQSESLPVIEELLSRNENAGYYLRRVNHHGNSEKTTTDYAVRLFPNRSDYRYRGRVHETIDASILAAGGRLVRTAIRIDHDFACDPETRRAKNLRYLDILNEEIADHPSDDSRLDFLATEYHQLGMFDKAADVAERIARVRPLDARAQLHAGVYHLLYNVDPQRARADFLQALTLRPGYPEAESFLQLLDERERTGAPQGSASTT